ncbi:MAG: bifunctional riboflavin kinase/FAD synthetase [Armatimonadetes bacterium]|nr:bifunctional riboflavin kinase/FAD synthetase [Armatimonadota bacterium]
MGVIYGLENIALVEGYRAVAIGVFDGVHWGHRAIFEKLVEAARLQGLKSSALTFDKHPAELLAPQRAPNYINTLEQRIEIIQALGVDEVVVSEFSHELASLERDEFINQILVETLHAKHVVVGANFKFGKNRQGDIRYLKSALIGLGIGISVVPAVIIGGRPVSSTRTRLLISRGKVAEAAILLGRRFTLRGEVVKGEKIGRTLGFSTANIAVADRQLIPVGGVYAVETTINGSRYGGVCNIGNRPTFSGKSLTIEAHFVGFNANIYGEMLDVVFCKRLRDEMTFESPERLADQIRKDIEMASAACAS